SAKTARNTSQSGMAANSEISRPLTSALLNELLVDSVQFFRCFLNGGFPSNGTFSYSLEESSRAGLIAADGECLPMGAPVSNFKPFFQSYGKTVGDIEHHDVMPCLFNLLPKGTIITPVSTDAANTHAPGIP